MISIVKCFILLHYFLGKIGLRLKGLGKAQQLLRNEFVFNFRGVKIFYDPKIEGSYDYLLIGMPNEPETHLLLDKVLSSLQCANFIDVGASVGEFVFGVSRYKNISNIFAFEPRPDCAEVLRKNVRLNNEDRIKIFENAVDDKGGGLLSLHLNPGGSSSGIYGHIGELNSGIVEVHTLTLDSSLPKNMQNPVLLIDVEGAEPLVLKGGQNFIEKNKPLIIFEYNNTSKQHYQLEEIIEILGIEYEIFSLRSDGNIDKDFSNSWNCVAVPSDTDFSEILSNSIKQAY